MMMLVKADTFHRLFVCLLDILIANHLKASLPSLCHMRSLVHRKRSFFLNLGLLANKKFSFMLDDFRNSF